MIQFQITLLLLMTVGIFLIVQCKKHGKKENADPRQTPYDSERIIKHPEHSHYWISNGMLYESYRTNRGIRFMDIMEMPDEPDNDNYKFPDHEKPSGMSWIQEEKYRKYHG